jgi:hypothetical protein
MVALIGLAATALGGCGSSSPPAGRPDATPESSISSPTAPSSTPEKPTTSSTPVAPPERPEAALGLSWAAGEAFIRHFIDLMNYSAQTGDVAPVHAASDPGCLGCAAYSDSVKKINQANGGLQGDYFERVLEVSQLTRATDGQLSASTKLKVGAYTARQSPTSKPVTITAAKYVQEMALAPSGGNWTVFEMELTKQ